MARTASNMLPLNTKAFDFSLLNTVNNKLEKLNSLKGEKGTIIMFICNHCPFVIHVNPELVNIANNYQQKGIGFIAINSNDVENYPQDGPELMTQHAKDNKYPFSYLYDETQEVAKAYKAACTPDFFLFNEDLEDSRPGNDKPLDGKYLRNALDSLLRNTKINNIQKPSIGCNIKWK